MIQSLQTSYFRQSSGTQPLASIDGDEFAIHIIAGFRTKEQSDASNVLWHSQTLSRVLFRKLLDTTQVLDQAIGQLRGEKAWRDGITGNITRLRKLASIEIVWCCSLTPNSTARFRAR